VRVECVVCVELVCVGVWCVFVFLNLQFVCVFCVSLRSVWLYECAYGSWYVYVWCVYVSRMCLVCFVCVVCECFER